MRVHKAADHSENQQDMQKHRVLRQFFIKDAYAAYHCNKVKKLAEECGNNFPQYGQYIRENFKPLYFIQRCRKQTL